VEEIRVETGGSVVTASVHGAGEVAVVLGPGAGGSRRTPILVRAAQALAASGRQAILYDFPYTEARRRIPDAPAVLEATTCAIDAHVRVVLGARRVVHGGKSMGGRIASQAVAKGLAADALVFVGYPLHPPGRVERLRDKHLPAIAVPMLFLQGGRDAFARWDLIENLTSRLAPLATLHRVDDADHSFVVPKRTGRTAADVEAELQGTIVTWLQAHGL
jgi:hypothetical protein